MPRVVPVTRVDKPIYRAVLDTLGVVYALNSIPAR